MSDKVRSSLNGAIIRDEEKNYKSVKIAKEILQNQKVKWKGEFILYNGTKLGDALMRLPRGIVDKRITGIGGTTLELNADRDSIIVEPLKSIAYSKSLLNKDYLYVGSATGNIKNNTTVEAIRAYHSNTKITNKKLIVVADSLPKVIEAIGNSAYEDYFLVIDEVDSFQSDSTFRASMDVCLNYYKKFNHFHRCMITATMLEFSDPDLAAETYTTIEYAQPISREISLINTLTLKSTVTEEIVEKVRTGKVVVAYNSIDESLLIIKKLVTKFNISKTDIKIACSKSNALKAGDYFTDIINEKLPSKITFLTSAYFTGIDINERYHSIAVSNGKVFHTLLSDHKLKQIAGRCRRNLSSETVIYYCLSSPKLLPYNNESLLKSAKAMVKGLECMDLQYKSDPILKNSIEEYQDSTAKIYGVEGYNLVGRDLNGKPQISYFNIDACLEKARLRNELYAEENQLKNKLINQGHKVLFEIKSSDWESEFDKTPIEKNENTEQNINDALDKLKLLKEGDEITLYDLLNNPGSSTHEKIYRQYNELNKYLEKNFLIDKILEYSSDRTIIAYRNFALAVRFEAMDGNNLLRQGILNAFPLGQTFSGEAIKDTLNRVYQQSGMHNVQFDSNVNAIRHLNCLFITKKRKFADKGKKDVIKIIGVNPYELTIKK